MAKSTYIPAADADFLQWLDHLLANLTPELGVTDANLQKLRSLSAELHAKLDTAVNAAAAAKQATSEKNNCRQLTETMIRAEIRRIKAHADYNATLGMHLWIEGTDHSNDLSHSSPELSGADQGGGNVSLGFTKGGSDGINIYSCRDGDSDWSLLNRATTSPYSDKRAPLQAGKPELRNYRAVFVVKDQEIGQFSKDLTVTCAP